MITFSCGAELGALAERSGGPAAWFARQDRWLRSPDESRFGIGGVALKREHAVSASRLQRFCQAATQRNGADSTGENMEADHSALASEFRA